MRITGMATGLDMDKIIKDSMKPYRIKVDQMTQKKDVVEIKQKLYRDIIKDNRDFFNKHLDIVKSDSLLKESNWSAVSFSSSDENAVTAKASGGAIKDNYTVNVEQLAAKATTTLLDGATGTQTLTTSAGVSVTFEVVNGKDNKETATNAIKAFNDNIKAKKKEIQDGSLSEDEKKKQLNTLNVTAKYSEISKGIIFEAKDFEQGGFKLTNSTGDATDKYLHATITTSKGKYEITDGINKTTSNTATVDGITFTFNQKTCDSSEPDDVKKAKAVTLTGKTDSKELKDKVVAFVNDYNKLIEKLNTTVNIKHDRSYNPLTAEQKKDMSESEIKLWNERVEKGQLYRDSDVTRIANSMKDSMRTFMKSSGLNLQEIGIAPVKDYSGTLNGTFTIDEDKLTKALENNTEDVMKLFTATPPEITKDDLNLKSITKDDLNLTDAQFTALKDEEKFNKLTPEQRVKYLTPEKRKKRNEETGILYKLKDTIDTEFRKSTSSPLLKKAGFEGTATFSTNQLSKNITNYEKKIKDMEKNFSRREQALYSKYASLEKMMNKLNSQQSNLMSQLGMS